VLNGKIREKMTSVRFRLLGKLKQMVIFSSSILLDSCQTILQLCGIEHNVFYRNVKASPHALSQKSETVAQKCDSRRKARQSPNFAVVSPFSATVALFYDSLTFVRQSYFSATVWTALNVTLCVNI